MAHPVHKQWDNAELKHHYKHFTIAAIDELALIFWQAIYSIYSAQAGRFIIPCVAVFARVGN